MNPHPRVIVALDYADAQAALSLVSQLEPGSCRLKVGKELFTSAGPRLVEQLVDKGFEVFLDLKFHDIPTTVAHACKAAAELGVWMVNVHAFGGRRMMEQAHNALLSYSRPPLLIAVTVLTSMETADLEEIGLEGDVGHWVTHLAGLAQRCGLDGVVCSAREAAALKRQCGADFKLVTPGIRPAGSASNDQARVVTPAQAVHDGADYLVIGRPITHAADPAQALAHINRELFVIAQNGS